MPNQDDIDRLRDHWHELRKAVDATGVTVAVIQERQHGIADQMDRIETSVLTCADLLQAQNGRLARSETQIAVLEARQADAANSGAKWGAGVGAAASALVAGLWHLMGGAK